MPDDLKDFRLGSFLEGDLFSLYMDREPQLLKSCIFKVKHPGILPHKHTANRLAAGKAADRRQPYYGSRRITAL